MKKELPKIDITEDFVIGSNADIDLGILNLYTQYPCRLKAEIFVLCMDGGIDASINLSEYTIKKNDFVTLSPGSIIQINRIERNLKLYFMVFSSEFINGLNKNKSIIDLIYITKNHPVLSLPEEFASIYEEFFLLMMKVYYKKHSPYNPEILKCMLLSILYRLSDMYHDQPARKETCSSRSEEICKTFGHLVIQHYTQERNVSYYAKKNGNNPGTLKQYSEKYDRKDGHGFHFGSSNRGCQSTAKINQSPYTGNSIFSKFPQRLFFWEVFQTAYRDDSTTIQK